LKILFEKGKKIAVAVSGGADSMVLLHLFQQENIPVSAVHVEHGIRGEFSRKDAEFVRSFCAERGIKLFTHRVDAPALAFSGGMSLELAARVLRYSIFDELLGCGIAQRIALGHHKDDQAETVLLRLFRGAGTRGLRGITDREGYIHPLLPYTKRQIEEYATKNGVPYIQDETNTDTSYARNFLRQEVIPLLKTRYPSLANNLYKSALSFAETEDFLLSQITPLQCENGKYYLPLSVLDRHPAIAKKSVQEALRALGVEKDVEFAHLESALRLKSAEGCASVNLPFNVDIVKEYDKLTFVEREKKTEFWETFSLDSVYRFKNKIYSFAQTESLSRGVLDAEKIPVGAVIRTRKEGDMFKRYKGKTKLLSDYLTDIKMPLRQRDETLVIALGKTVFAVLGCDIADSLKVDETTRVMRKIAVCQEERGE
jgi:tRNA(Ile)-lysidine synthase